MAERIAILIGIDGYSFRPLTSAVNDALAMRKALLGLDSPGLEPILTPDGIRLLLTPRQGDPPIRDSVPATRQAILDTLKPQYDNPDPAEFLLVFFAGHGVVVSPDGRVRETLILPSDVAGPEEGRNMICLTDLLALFAERGPRQQLWIVDACRDMPYNKRPRGYSIDWTEQTPQAPRAQVAIFAVAQGGTALSHAGGHGRFTSHLVDGLAGKGAAADYMAGRGHCVTAQSLHDYLQRRVREALTGYDDWTRTVQMPQIGQSGPGLSPLRDIPPPPPRRFAVTVRPQEAEPAVNLALEVQLGLPVQGWPPLAPPRIYELRATLQPGMEQVGWGRPVPQLRAVDLREESGAVVDVPRADPQQPTARPAQATTGESGIARAQTLTQKSSPFSFGILPVAPKAIVTVLAADAVAHVRLRRAQAPWDEIEAAVNVPFDVTPGVWDLTVRLGDETISATRVVLRDRERRTIQAIAQITPATAALLRGTTGAGAVDATPGSVTAPGTVGPMQGAILRTLLPLLALKLYDRDHAMKGQFEQLGIPMLEEAEQPPGGVPFAAAIALEGVAPHERLPSVANARRVWTGAESRIVLAAGWTRDARGTVTMQLGAERVSVATPTVRDGVTVIAATSWPDGRLDLSVGVFRLPVGTSWDPRQPLVPAVDRIARTLAIAVPLFRQGVNLEEVPDPVVTNIAYAKWVDPVLGALAFHARDHRFTAEAGRLNEQFAAHLRDFRETIRRNMREYFSDLPDSRVIAALDPEPDVRHAALVGLLHDPELRQPVLTVSLAHLARAAIRAGLEDHWTVERFDRVAPGQVFNVIRTAREDRIDAPAH